MNARIGLAILCWVWAGMLLGISFLETPVKFTAPSVTLPIGLDVGRHVFGVFNKVEIGAALLAGALLLRLRPAPAAWIPLSGVFLIVALQSAWLLPLLDARTGMILRGQAPPPSPHHVIYILLDVLKLGGLAAAGLAGLRALTDSRP